MDFFNQPDSSPVRETSPELEGASEAETWDHGTQGSWLDEEAVKPFNEPNKASKLCHACLPFFTFGKKPGESHRHLRFRSSLQAALRQGCHLCAVVWNKIQLESVGREAPAKIELTYWLTTDLGPGCELHVSFQVYRCTNGQQNQLGRGSAEFRFALPKEVEHLDGEVNSVHTASAASQTLALHWLQQCNRDHVTCNGIRIRQDWMPTRLLSICGSSSTNRIKIIETNKSSPREYIALSHCWGLNPIITLTTTNSNSFKEGIDIDLLPKNFRDAIEIARWVCVGYLWVDSLCILQDSLDDWKKEAVTMKDVYKNALLTVAATRAQNSSIGCFTDRDPSLIRGFKIPTEQNGRSSDPLYCFDKDIWADGVSEAPLNTRAWVVQERFLSRRTLHFGAQQIFWECHELDGCEAYPRGFPPAIRNANTLNHFKDIQLTRHVVSNTAGLRIVTYYPQWERIIDAYTLSNLTKSTDKIIALSGIAAEMESLYGDEYLAGLWRRYLPELLMWTVSWESTWRVINSHLTSRCQYYRAPSWSWLSIDGPISSGTAHDLPVFIEILDVNVNYDIDRITAGYVRIRGVLTEAQTEWEEFEGGGSIRLLQGQEEDLADAYLDDNSEKPPDKVLLLPIIPGWYSARYDDTIEVKGLILCPTGKNELEYRRLGWFSSRGKEDCYAIEQGPRTTSKWNEVYISDDEIAELGEIEPQTFDDGGRDNLYRHLPTTVFTLV